MKNKAILLLAISLSGCASELKVYDDRGVALPGFPVRQPVIFVESGIYLKLAKGGACDPAPYQSYVSQPVGAKIYVNVKPAQFAKTAFDLKLTSSGGAQEVSLNTEPSSGDILTSAANAVKTIAPIAGLAAPLVQPGAAGAALPPCDTAPDPTKIVRRELTVN
jgi:hypothetical protein